MPHTYAQSSIADVNGLLDDSFLCYTPSYVTLIHMSNSFNMTLTHTLHTHAQSAIAGMNGMSVDSGKRLRVEIKKARPGQPY